MDHREAASLMASEKYLLNELSAAEMEAFEEHFFDCHECAMDMRAGSLLIEQGKAAMTVPATVAKSQPSAGDAQSGWFAWLRPAFAVPAFALLLLVIGYQNLVTYPQLKSSLAQSQAPRILTAAPLVNGVTRGASSPVLQIRAGEPFLLPLEIVGQSGFQSYRVELLSPAEGVEWVLPVSSTEINNTLTIVAPGVKQAGKYELVVTGLNGPNPKEDQKELERYPIELQFPGAGNPTS